MKSNFNVAARGTAADKCSSRKLKLAILYHFMYPDDVVSALHMDGLAQDLAVQGWEVEALPCNRGCRDETKLYSPAEVHKSVRFQRIWRPNFSQRSFWGRLANSVWMIASWSKLAFRPKNLRPDVIVIGTDPVFAAVAAIPLRFFAPGIRLVHWCFDMHPEAAIALRMVSNYSLSARLMRSVMRKAYASFDVIADLGACMRKLLQAYGHSAVELELTPWALVEPEQPALSDLKTRHELFGDARIGILYSGNFGEAHDFLDFLALARALRDKREIHFCFAVRGNRSEELRKAVTEEDHNVSFAEFAPIQELEKRLGSADIHLVSLKKEWAGIAVPSKFFGSIASGRPIIYSGPRESAIGEWIRKYRIGWTIDSKNISVAADIICQLTKNKYELADLQAHCHSVYQSHFSRKSVTEKWNTALMNLVADLQ